ncbi:MAG: hypothetical protein AB4426_14020 [Xenococcaceae cyanobacterium]
MTTKTATKWEIVEQWLKQVEGSQWFIVQASDNSPGVPVTAATILETTMNCQWAQIDDMSETPYVKQGFMFPECLQVGWGDVVEACRQGNSEKSGVFFFNAYKPTGSNFCQSTES